MNKKIFVIVAFCVVFAVLFALIFSTYYRFRSYDEFLMLVSNLKHFKIQGFYEEPLDSRFANAFVSGSLNPKKLYLLKNNTIQSFVEKSDYSIFTTGLLPASSFGFIHPQKYFSEKYRISERKVNDTEGFSKSFFVRFYNPDKRILSLVILRYTPGINKKMLLFSSGSPVELGVTGMENYTDFTFKKDILEHFGDSERNINENIDVYSGKHFIVSVICFTPKAGTDNSKNTGYFILRFEKDLLSMLYNFKNN